jgi:hypothetical protein
MPCLAKCRCGICSTNQMLSFLDGSNSRLSDTMSRQIYLFPAQTENSVSLPSSLLLCRGRSQTWLTLTN